MTLTHRISAGVICEQDGRLLLVNTLKPGVHNFWVAPGGGAEGDEDLRETAKRETLEECGLIVEVERLAYIEELIWDRTNVRHCKHWFIARVVSGNIDVSLNPAQDEAIVAAAWLSRDDMQGKLIYPPVLTAGYWRDKQSGFQDPRYLGIRHTEL